MINRKLYPALGLALTLAACATAPSLRAPTRTLALSGPILSKQARADAQAFEAFTRRAAGIDADFSGPAEIRQALTTGAGYEPRQLEAGMIAYAALAALEEPRFVAGVLQASRAKGGRDLAARLAARPDLVSDLAGAAAAQARAAGALYRQGAPLAAEGKQVKAAAYSIQHQAWSTAKVSDPRGRLTRVKLIGAGVYRPDAKDRGLLDRAVAQVPARTGAGASPVIQRGVALAALSLLGQADKGQALMREPKSGMCLRLAKLDFHQCLASAGPYYEDIYCLGQHAMIDPGQCVVSATR